MKTVAIIQARMGSTRLPGKVLMDIAGRSMLAWVVSRTRRAATVDEVVVATTDSPADDAIVAECAAIGVPVFRGSEDDVLDRYHRTAEAFDADPVVRITSDCPLIDPGVVDLVVGTFRDLSPDYAGNALERRFPRGLDCEAISSGALLRTWREAREPYERAHVTPFIYQHPELFRLVSVRAPINHGAMRWTVDTKEDLEFVRAVFAGIPHTGSFSYHDALDLLRARPELAKINQGVSQKCLSDG